MGCGCKKKKPVIKPQNNTQPTQPTEPTQPNQGGGN